jgi:hypothetical protein
VGKLALIDLRATDPQIASRIDHAKRMRVQDQVSEIDIRRAFDLLIHVPRISLWRSQTNATMPDLRERPTPPSA